MRKKPENFPSSSVILSSIRVTIELLTSHAFFYWFLQWSVSSVMTETEPTETEMSAEMSRSCVLQKTDRSQVSEDRTLKKTVNRTDRFGLTDCPPLVAIIC